MTDEPEREPKYHKATISLLPGEPASEVFLDYFRLKGVRRAEFVMNVGEPVVLQLELLVDSVASVKAEK